MRGIASISLTGLLAIVGCVEKTAFHGVTSHSTLPESEPQVPLVVESQPMTDKIVRSEEDWKQRLTPQQYHVLREKGTERPFTNVYDHHFEPGAYACAACGQELFTSDTKFNSGCGWPAFYAAKAKEFVVLTSDLSHGMLRTEVTCARCGSHLGHIFDDAPQTPTGQRYCINSVSLTFIPLQGTDETTSRQQFGEQGERQGE